MNYKSRFSNGLTLSHFIFTIIAFLLFTVGISHAQGVLDPDLPPAKTIGAPTIIVHQEAGMPGTVTLANGTVISTNQYNQPLMTPLATALKLALPGDVIACQGELEGVQIGKYDPNKPFAVWWPNGQVIRNVSIVSEIPSQPCIIRGVSIQGNILQAAGHGVDDITFKDVKLKNMGSSATAFIVSMNSVQGMIRLYNVDLISGSPGSYGGYGLKWGIRANGPARYDIRGFKCPAAEEHCLYLDSVGADAGGDSYFLDITQKAPSGRTGIQIVNRKDPIHGSMGMSGLGNLYFRRLKLSTVAGGGGSGFTIVGHLGGVFLKDLRYKGNLGAVVFWSDSSKGLHLTPDGYTVPYARIEDVYVDAPAADRDHIMISGVKHVQIKRFLVKGNKAAFSFNSSYGGPIPNGLIEFIGPKPLSAYTGFKAGQKIKINNQVQTNQQIDFLFP